VEQDKNPWHKLSSRVVYDNPWINVREDAVIRPDGNQGIYGVVHFKNIAVGILPIDNEYIYLVGQYRYTLNAYSWEIPEGGCPETEDTLDAAKRELEEETGLRASIWEKLGEAYLSNSVSDEKAVWYLATDLSHGTFNPEGSEQLALRRILFEDALQMVLNGEITDALSMLAILSYKTNTAKEKDHR
jgi:8-oxo-dGTP pyrophosphatase MutT (NUDIX family)